MSWSDDAGSDGGRSDAGGSRWRGAAAAPLAQLGPSAAYACFTERRATNAGAGGAAAGMAANEAEPMTERKGSFGTMTGGVLAGFRGSFKADPNARRGSGLAPAPGAPSSPTPPAPLFSWTASCSGSRSSARFNAPNAASGAAGGEPSPARAWSPMPSSPQHGGAPAPSVLDALGGPAALKAVLEDMVARMLSDERVKHHFAGSSHGMLLKKQRSFLEAALGGKDVYMGPSMYKAHAHLKLTDADFDVFLAHTIGALRDANVDGDIIEQVHKALLGLADPVLGKEAWGP